MNKPLIARILRFFILMVFLPADPLWRTPATGAEPVSFTVGHFQFERPEGWLWVNPSSPMRKAELTAPSSGEASRPEVTFFHFGPGQGGGAEANIGRWLAQFQEAASEISPAIETGVAGKTKVTFVKAKGTFLSGMPGGPSTPRPGYALYGAILENAKYGDVFVKMTGPAEAVASAGEAFERMIKTAAASHTVD